MSTPSIPEGDVEQDRNRSERSARTTMTRSFRAAGRIIKREPSLVENPGDRRKATALRRKALPSQPDNDVGEDWARIEF